MNYSIFFKLPPFPPPNFNKLFIMISFIATYNLLQKNKIKYN